MIEVTGVVQQEAWRARSLPPVELVRPGLWSIPVPIPDNPLRYVLVYVFELDDGVVVVDAGWPTDDAWQALVNGLAETGHDVADVRGIVVTHVHPDHHGLAGRLREASGAWIGMHELELATLDARRPERITELVERSTAWLLGRGASAAEATTLAGSPERLALSMHLARPDRLVADDELVLDDGRWRLRAIWTPGHTRGHLCFREERLSLVLSGDHVLPRISPNISMQPGQLDSPLADYLASLERIASYRADEVLPAHEYRFAGLQDRCKDLAAHHAARLSELAAAVESHPGATTWEIAAYVSWSRPWSEVQSFMRRAAVGETMAHLCLLECHGRVHNTGHEVDCWQPGK